MVQISIAGALVLAVVVVAFVLFFPQQDWRTGDGQTQRPLTPQSGYEECPIIEDADDRSSPYDTVTILPTLMERLERAVRLNIERDGHTIERLEITEDMGALETVWLDELAAGDRYGMAGPNPKLPDGRILYKTVDTRGLATFEDGTEIEFRVYFGTLPSHAKQGCAVSGVAIQPSWLHRN